MAETLTPQQHEAVYNRGGNLLVSAAAGSGKTKVLVDRILSYITDPVDPANLDDFLIITYTKAAASELRSKIAAKLNNLIAQHPENKHLQKQMQRLFLAKISTVHSFCGDILREYAYKLDISPDFRVVDESESRELRDSILSELLDETYRSLINDPDLMAFIDNQGFGRDDRFVPDILEKVYNSARCHLCPDEWLEQCLSAATLHEDTDISETLWGQYLIQDLKEYLTVQTEIFRKCIWELEHSEGMDKPAANLRTTLRQLEVLKEADSWAMIVGQSDIDFGRLTFPRKNVDLELAERIKAARNACKKGLERKLLNFSDSVQQIHIDQKQSYSSLCGLISLVKQFDRKFTAAKNSRHILDFSDLEHKTLDLLLGKSRSSPTLAAEEIAERFREIMVDEYQDSNGVQDAIFSALSRRKQNCFLVGDVKQSIYQFRLSDPKIFLEKYNTYVDTEYAAAGQGRRVFLSQNFRSGPEIIECVNSVFQVTMSPKVGGLRYGEKDSLKEGIPHEPLTEPAVELYALDIQEDTYVEEAAFVAERIRKMLTEGSCIRKNGTLQPVMPEDIVILLRSPGTSASYFQKALENEGIRCTTGAGCDLLKTEEICTLRSLLQVIMNPRLDIPLLSVLASPVFGFTANQLAQIRSHHKKGSFYDALCQSDLKIAEDFLNVLQILRSEARMRTLTSLLEICFRLTKFDTIYSSKADGDLKSANIRSFYQIAAEYEKQSLKDLSQFIDYLNTMDERGLIISGNQHSDAVTIMSIHKSKGLEFPVVFLSNLSRRFNLEDLRAQILCDKELGLGLSIADNHKRIRYPSAAKRAISAKMEAESISEEMRVLYVAMTRAKDRLIMTYASQNLESDIQNLVLRMDFNASELVCQEATCMGDWILFAALQRMEAGELHVYGGRPKKTFISQFPWRISVSQPTHSSNYMEIKNQKVDKISPEQLSIIKSALNFQYPHFAATYTPSKQTATGQKGREKDQEAAQNTLEPPVPVRKMRTPTFIAPQISGKEYGNAMHTVMQYISYEKCNNLIGIQEELSRIVQCGFLLQEQINAIDPNKILHFFSSEIGTKLRSGVPYLREFKFSILDDGSKYDSALENEKILLQGVVDCVLLEEDGITIIDFKTDYVTEDTLPNIASRYRSQVQTYADAIQRICEQPIKDTFLYLFHLDHFLRM